MGKDDVSFKVSADLRAAVQQLATAEREVESLRKRVDGLTDSLGGAERGAEGLVGKFKEKAHSALGADRAVGQLAYQIGSLIGPMAVASAGMTVFTGVMRQYHDELQRGSEIRNEALEESKFNATLGPGAAEREQEAREMLGRALPLTYEQALGMRNAAISGGVEDQLESVEELAWFARDPVRFTESLSSIQNMYGREEAGDLKQVTAKTLVAAQYANKGPDELAEAIQTMSELATELNVSDEEALAITSVFSHKMGMQTGAQRVKALTGVLMKAGYTVENGRGMGILAAVDDYMATDPAGFERDLLGNKEAAAAVAKLKQSRAEIEKLQADINAQNVEQTAFAEAVKQGKQIPGQRRKAAEAVQAYTYLVGPTQEDADAAAALIDAYGREKGTVGFGLEKVSNVDRWAAKVGGGIAGWFGGPEWEISYYEKMVRSWNARYGVDETEASSGVTGDALGKIQELLRDIRDDQRNVRDEQRGRVVPMTTLAPNAPTANQELGNE